MDPSLEVEVQLCDVCQCEGVLSSHSNDEHSLGVGQLLESLDEAHEVCLLDVVDVLPPSGLASPQRLPFDSPSTTRPDSSSRTTRFDEPPIHVEWVDVDQLRVLDKLEYLTGQIHLEMKRWRHQVESKQSRLDVLTTTSRNAMCSFDDSESHETGVHKQSLAETFCSDARTSAESAIRSTVRTQRESCRSESHLNRWRMSVHSAFEEAMMATRTPRLFDLFATTLHFPTTASIRYDSMLQSWRTASLFLTRRRLRLDGLRRFVEHNGFQTTIFLLIVANSLLIGISAHLAITESFDAYDARSQGMVRPQGRLGWVRSCEEVFAVTFSVEMALRLLAHEGEYFLSLWNTGELCAVVSTVSNTFSPNLTPTSLANAMVLLRFVRPERLLLVVSYLRFAPQVGGMHLRLLVLACKTSIGALGWATVLLACLLLLSSIVFVQGASTYVDDASPSDPFVEDLREHFRSMPKTMLTLFVCLLGEADFKSIINVLRKVGHWYLFLFIALLLFLTLSVANVIVGVFVSDAIQVAKNDREITMRDQMLEARQNMNDLNDLWFVLELNHQQSLTRDQFRVQMRRPDVRQFLAKFKLDATDVDALFDLMDVDQTGEVDVEEFIVGCMRVRGMSNEVDTGITVQETKMLAKRIHRTMKTIQKQSVSVQSELRSLSCRMVHLELAVGLV